MDERMAVYLASLEQNGQGLLGEIEREAIKSSVPVIRKEMQSFLKVLLQIQQPLSVLEVGTAVGFSALLMSSCIPEEGHITTIENYEKRIPLARENFRRAGREEQITLLEGDALEIMKGLEGQYPVWLPEVLRLLRPGGVLLSDNVLQEGSLLDSRFAVERRDRTIHERMRSYLYELKHREDLETTILPLGDGAALTVKRR